MSKSTATLLAAAGYDSPLFCERIERYLSEMRHWNSKHNLTAITNPDEMVRKHIIDSLSISDYIDRPKLLDIGTGAGLPGIPLAMHCPDTHFTLLDSASKRTFFLQHIKGVCEINNCSVVHSRIEDFDDEETNHNQFDLITCRAFASLKDIVTSSQRLLKHGGRYIAMKGDIQQIEIDEFTNWAESDSTTLQISEIVSLDVPALSAQRHLIIIE